MRVRTGFATHLASALGALALVLSTAACDFEMNGDIPIGGKHVHISLRTGAPSCLRGATPKP